MILDRVADIYRLQKDSNNANKESYQVYTPLANTPLNIQPATPEDIVIANGVFGHTWVGFTTASGIINADKLIIQITGEILITKGKQNWMSPEGIPHVELLLVDFETGE
jgi:hypothetical protein